MASSIETSVKQWADEQIRQLGWRIIASENESADETIDESLKKNPSKSGGEGGGRPDYTVIVTNGDKTIPVFIEYKGSKGKLEKLDKQGLVILRSEYGQFDYKLAIPKYAVNGAAYYAMNTVRDTAYQEAVAVGINGTKDTSGTIQYEITAYVLNKQNPELPIKLGDYPNLDFLKNIEPQKSTLFQSVSDVQTDPKELEQRAIRDDAKIEAVLQELNQKIYDEQQIIPSERINMVAGSLMAAVGVKDDSGNWKVSRLKPSELVGSDEEDNTDGDKIIAKIKNFLKERSLPEKKQKQILNTLRSNFVDNNLNHKTDKETQTPIKKIYQEIYDKLIPLYDATGINDFTGKLFNVMNSWVNVADGGDNDVVLTPRYVTNFMAQLAQVNQDSYVWDWALGSGGFLISAMNLMIQDAKVNYANNLTKQHEKIESIKTKQLLGVELLSNVYMLAVLNMILMGDGSSNIVNDDSLTKYDGKYAYNEDPFPADVFLLNPPYSAEGNGMIFVKKAFEKQSKGFGAVIIQDSAGSGKATEINKQILKNNRLKASIKMPIDLFKASVQTSIYLFEVGKPHKADDNVYFIDLREDGYTRTNRKKAKVNLFNSNDAKGHYQEVIDIILDKSKKTNYFTEGDNYYKGTIDPTNGKDWNYNKKIDTTPTEADFKKTVSDYLSWEVSQILKGQNQDSGFLSSPNSEVEKRVRAKYTDVVGKLFRIGDLFEIGTGSLLSADEQVIGDVPRISVKTTDNGILGLYNTIENKKARHFKNVISVNFFGNAYYHPYKASFDMKVHTLKIPNHSFNRETGLYLTSLINQLFAGRYSYGTQLSSSKLKKEDFRIEIPTHANGEIAFDYMEAYIKELEAERIKELEAERIKELEAYLVATGLNDYKLTDSEKAVIDEFRNGNVKMGGV